MVHLFWCVTVAVDHTVGRNDDKGVGSVNLKSSHDIQLMNRGRI